MNDRAANTLVPVYFPNRILLFRGPIMSRCIFYFIWVRFWHCREGAGGSPESLAYLQPQPVNRHPARHPLPLRAMVRTGERILASWRQHIFFATLPIILIPLGMVFYGIYCWITVGDFLAFLHVQQHSGRYIAWPWQGIVQAFIALFVIPQPFGSSNEAHLLLDLCATLVLYSFIILGWRKFAHELQSMDGFHYRLYPSLSSPGQTRYSTLQSTFCAGVVSRVYDVEA